MRFLTWLVTTLLFISVLPVARADGGIIRLHEGQGPFAVTVFSPAEISAGGLADVSVLIQGRENGKVVLDANVSFTLTPPNGLARVQSDEVCGLPVAAMRAPVVNPNGVRATREQASNKLLYAAPLGLNRAGVWKLCVIVSRGTDDARFDCALPVISASGKLIRLWPYLSLPALAVAFFAVNQWLRRQSLQKADHAI